MREQVMGLQLTIQYTPPNIDHTSIHTGLGAAPAGGGPEVGAGSGAIRGSHRRRLRRHGTGAYGDDAPRGPALLRPPRRCLARRPPWLAVRPGGWQQHVQRRHRRGLVAREPGAEGAAKGGRGRLPAREGGARSGHPGRRERGQHLKTASRNRRGIFMVMIMMTDEHV